MRISFLLPALAYLALPAASGAQQLSTETIVCKLDPSCAKPGIGQKHRGLTETASTPDSQANAVDLNIQFDYNSAVLQNDARITLDALGRALQDPRLASYAFLIGGHTDAKGSDAYNRLLSERRAKAVRTYLVSRFGIPVKRLSAKGFGRQQPLDPEYPDAEVNRRVQIVTLPARISPE